MEFIIILGLIFFCGLGFVFEVLGFLFRLLFSGLGLVIALIVAAALSLAIVPLFVGFLGFMLPKGLLIAGFVFLAWAVINQSRRRRRYY